MAHKKQHGTFPEHSVRYNHVTCDNCDTKLQPSLAAHEDGHGWRYLLPADGLVLSLISYYEAKIDLISDTPPNIVLCSECSNKLFETFPAIHHQLNSHE